MTDIPIRSLIKDPNVVVDPPAAKSDAVWIQYLAPQDFIIPRSKIYFSGFERDIISRYDETGKRVSKRRLRRILGKLKARR